MSKHPHLGRIQAVAHLSDMYAKSYCAEEALFEDGVPVAFFAGQHPRNVRQILADQADLILEPFGIANVLQTIEETLADGPAIPDLGAPETVRFQIVMAIVDAALAAREDERETDPELRRLQQECAQWSDAFKAREAERV